MAEQFVSDAAVSEENQAQLDADVLVMFYSDVATREAREESELFQQVPAVDDDRYVAVVGEEDERAEDGAIWALRRGTSVLSIPWTLDALADWAGEAGVEGRRACMTVNPSAVHSSAGDPTAAHSAFPPIRRSLGLRRAAGGAVVLVALGALAALSLSHGSNPIPAADVWAGLWARDATEASLIVWEERIPRMLVGVVVGSCFGVAGALIQALTRNPLADPGILGGRMPVRASS